MSQSSFFQIGITGGIGSGKTWVCRIFEGLGYRIYSADERAKALMQEDPQLVVQIKALLGEEAYDAAGHLQRAYIARQVFADPNLLKQLNALVHPATGRDYEQWVANTPADYEKEFLLKEAAILYESGAYRHSDAVITVYAPKAIRLERVMKRDQVPAKAVLQRMSKQWPDAEKIRRADWIIINDGQHFLLPQVRHLLRSIKDRLPQGNQ